MKPDVYCIEDANGNIEKTRSAATMKTGEHYWCIQPSIESENHGDINFVEPWYGVLTISESGSMLLSRVGKIYPEGDDDENATAFITNENQLYLTEIEAKRALLPRLHEYREKYQNGLKLLDQYISDLTNSIIDEDISEPPGN